MYLWKGVNSCLIQLAWIEERVRKSVSPGLQKNCCSCSPISTAIWSYHKNLYPRRTEREKKKIILTSFWMIFILRVEFARLASIQKNQSTSYKSRKVAYTSVLHMERQELRRTLKCTLTGTLPLVESQRNNDIWHIIHAQFNSFPHQIHLHSVLTKCYDDYPCNSITVWLLSLLIFTGSLKLCHHFEQNRQASKLQIGKLEIGRLKIANK